MVNYVRWYNLFHMLVNYFECVQTCHEWWVANIPSMYNRVIVDSYVSVLQSKYIIYLRGCVYAMLSVYYL